MENLSGSTNIQEVTASGRVSVDFLGEISPEGQGPLLIRLNRISRRNALEAAQFPDKGSMQRSTCQHEQTSLAQTIFPLWFKATSHLLASHDRQARPNPGQKQQSRVFKDWAEARKSKRRLPVLTTSVYTIGALSVDAPTTYQQEHMPSDQEPRPGNEMEAHEAENTRQHRSLPHTPSLEGRGR
ncbi:hypothetical protein HPB48_009459 [Haemaphysalis longicornis]|uniref:Uncharacterized protein n=1 Tax=Haemaphysalis longicornis TaxID=44386 RepID=A0A9J6G4T5_HAELO|nr:hypothetical protein HPB48_009459 [Haemaphysalis longicornis]